MELCINRVMLLFLSCLYGSQRFPLPKAGTHKFLSCLYGSQHQRQMHHRPHTFLSCLYGSQQKFRPGNPTREFLSCLYGSQPEATGSRLARKFLSCLYGSQLQKKVKELRRHRGKTHLHLFYPKFQRSAIKADRIGFYCIGQKFWLKFRHRGTIAQAIGTQCSRLLYLTGCLLDEEGKGLRGR